MKWGILLLLAGCASAPVPRKSECHVLRVEPVVEKIGDVSGGSTLEKYLAWCGEGRYVVFTSSVSAGQIVTFDEYQEDDQLQIYGAVRGIK